MKKVEAFTDGSSLGNPGPGGYGAILRFTDSIGKVHEKELSEGFSRTTNGRMEIMGVIAVLEALKEPCDVTITSDAQYVVNAFEKHWIDSWKKNGWKKSNKKPVLNVDLWKKVDKLRLTHKVKLNWIKGHAGYEMNERCDVLAKKAASKLNLLKDTGYEKQSQLSFE